MKRLKLLLGMAALACAIGLTVKYGSAYRPVVGPVREIEAIWAIEDERKESEEPLVTRLFCNGAEAAYDAESNTFYCTLGLENGEEWPEIKLTTAKNVGGGLTLCFVDDYAYDACADAIREGYAYQIMAYTDEAYSYSDVVFTGLPILSLHTAEAITTEDTPAALNLAFGNGERLEANARAHLRGNASLVRLDKHSYKVEFTRTEDGKKKIPQNVPGLGQTDEIILLAMGFDPNMVRDRLSWSMIERIWPKDEAFAPVGREYVEVFVNDAYQGAYLMMVPFDRRAEIEKAGAGSAQRDSLYRSVIAAVDKGRQIDEGYELFIAPDAENPFAGLQTYLRLDEGEMDDETFCREAAAHIDVPSLMRYTLLVQGMALCDNIFNNMYVWAHETAAGVVYRFIPWDMDLSWEKEPGAYWDCWMIDALACRVIELDVSGARGELAAQWKRMSEAGFTIDAVREELALYQHELTDSGAFLRDAERWGKEQDEMDVSQIEAVAEYRFELLGRLTQAIGETGEEFRFADFETDEEYSMQSMADALAGE